MSRPKLTINVAQGASAEFALVALRGPIDTDQLACVGERLSALLRGGVRFVVLDISEVTRFDAQVWTIVADARQQLRTRQGWLRLVGAAGSAVDGTVATLADLFAVYRSVVPEYPPMPAAPLSTAC